MGEDSNATVECDSTIYPLIQVDEDDDYFDGPMESEYETDDSNGHFWGLIFESGIYFGKPRPFLYRLGVLGSNKSGSPKFLISNTGSNVIPAENNPLNDYPDEQLSEDEEVESRSSYDQSTEEHSAYEEDNSDHNEETDWRWELR